MTQPTPVPQPTRPTALRFGDPAEPAALAAPTPAAAPDAPPIRVGCVNLPHAAMAVEVRDNPLLADRPAVIAAAQPGAQTVHDLTHAAHMAGVMRGMTVFQARKLCPDLVVVPPRPDAYRDAFQRLLDALAEYTGAVEPADLEHAWLSASGLARDREDEAKLAEAVAARAALATGLTARVGVAHGKLTSRIVTRYLQARPAMALPRGREVAFLGGLSIRYLPLATSTQERILALGLGKVHQYAALPQGGILPRFGYEGLRAWRLGHGHDDEAVQPWRSEPFLEAEHVFAEPVANLRSLRWQIERLVYELVRPLSERFQMASAMALTVTFERGQVAAVNRTFLEPSIKPSVLLTHMDALMAAVQWAGPVERVKLLARGLCPTIGHQLDLFRHTHARRLEAETALRDLQHRYGPDVVRQGRVVDAGAALHERRARLVPWPGGEAGAEPRGGARGRPGAEQGGQGAGASGSLST